MLWGGFWKKVQEYLLRVCLHVPQMIVIIDWLIMCGSLVYVYRPIPVWIYFNSSAGGIFRWYVEIILVSIVCAIYCYNYIQWNKWHYKILWSLTFWSEINEGIFTSSSQVCVVVGGGGKKCLVLKYLNIKIINQYCKKPVCVHSLIFRGLLTLNGLDLELVFLNQF